MFVRFEGLIGSEDSSIKRSYNLVSRRVADFFGFNFLIYLTFPPCLKEWGGKDNALIKK